MSSNTEIHQIPVQFMFKQIYTKDSIVHLRKTVSWGRGEESNKPLNFINAVYRFVCFHILCMNRCVCV